MCGRYRLSRRKELIEKRFDVPLDDTEGWAPRYNIAPTQFAPVIRQHPKEPHRVMTSMRWGLIAHWAKSMSEGARKINAASETAARLPSFRDALKSRRCLVPADGFYEWRRIDDRKQPYCFEVNDGELFAFAGLWDRWKEPGGAWIRSFTVLTTTPNAVTSAVHDRMPVILDREDYDLWLDPAMTDVEAVADLLKPYRADVMRAYPVSSRVNHIGNDDADCSARVEVAELPSQSKLF
jgi:putative SOS response-associated peptidase YedK